MREATNTTRRERWLITSGCLVLLLVAVGVTIAFLQTVATRADEALESKLAALREAGHPVYPEDIAVDEADHDPATANWLRGFRSVARSGSTESEESFDADWAECVRSNDPAVRLLQETGFDRYLDETDVPKEASPCELVALRLAYGEPLERYERALEIAGRGSFDGMISFRKRLKANPDALPQLSSELPVAEYLDATRILSNSAILSATNGELERAEVELTLSLRAARLMQSQHCLLGEHVLSSGLASVLRALEVLLHYAPPEIDLAELEAFLNSWDPRKDMHESLIDERAFGNGVFRVMRNGGLASQPDEPTSLGNEFVFADAIRVDAAQLVYLETMGRILEECAQPVFDPSGACDRELEEMRDSPWVHPGLDLLSLKASDLHTLVLTNVVRRDLAIAALRVHREGLKRAEAVLGGLIDPFAGKPYRRRLEGERLVMWSVGMDGTDAGAALGSARSAHADLTWHCWRSRASASESAPRVHPVGMSPSSALLTALCFDATGEVGFAVGGSSETGPAEILRTITRGATWQRVETAIDRRLYDIVFRTEHDVFAVGLGGEILRSIDTGTTWTSVRQGDEWLAGIAFTSEQEGWVVGSRGQEAVLMRSTDGGSTWSEGPELPADVRESSLRAIEFRDAEFGCVVGTGGALLVTRDGGESWSSYPASGYLRGVGFSNDGSIWVVGGPGVVLRSSDDGRTFESLAFPVQGKLNSIAFSTAARGWVTTMEGELYETVDGGDTWISTFRTENLHLTGIRAPRFGEPGFVVGDRGTILRLELGR